MPHQYDKADDIKEIKADVKEVKSLLHENLIAMTKLDKDVSLHKKLWGGLIGILVSIGVFFTQRQFL